MEILPHWHTGGSPTAFAPRNDAGQGDDESSVVLNVWGTSKLQGGLYSHVSAVTSDPSASYSMASPVKWPTPCMNAPSICPRLISGDIDFPVS